MGETFFINKNNGACRAVSGWLVVKETNFTDACDWDKHSTYPQFLYSRNGEVTNWNDMSKILLKSFLSATFVQIHKYRTS